MLFLSDVSLCLGCIGIMVLGFLLLLVCTGLPVFCRLFSAILGSGAVPLGGWFPGVALVLVWCEPLCAFEVEEPAFVEGAGPILEGAAAGIRVEGTAFPIAAFLVCRFAAELSEFFADARVVKSAIVSSVAVPSGIESTCFFFLFGW